MTERVITVKGIGKVQAKVDYIVVSLTLTNLKKDYHEVMSLESERLNLLTAQLCNCGFEKNEIKTTEFNVDSVYESESDANGNYKEVFKGFKCIHQLKIAFDYNMTLLNQVLTAVSKSNSNPKINISFTVKDKKRISDELLKAACKDAIRKATVLCEASGYKLGALLKLDYNWNEVCFESKTEYSRPSIFERKIYFFDEDIDIQPEDISANDSAVFVWEII